MPLFPFLPASRLKLILHPALTMVQKIKESVTLKANGNIQEVKVYSSPDGNLFF
jgi:hypothetical protein